LENAGDKEDIAFIKENITAFIGDYEVLLGNISTALSKEKSNGKKGRVDAGTLKQYLKEFKTTLTELNAKNMRAISGVLRNVEFDEETDQIISTMLHNRLIGNYDEAMILADRLLDKLGG